MSDSDALDIDDGESPEASSSPKKKGGGLAALLPNILKFAAIGLGALIFIVTVAVVTYNIMNKGGKSQTVVTDPTSPYIGKRPNYAIFTSVGSVTTKTKDVTNYSVTVVMNIGYDIDDQVTASELNTRQYELRDFVRRYFTGKYATDLAPEKEEQLKQEIKEILNTRFLDTAKVRLILFDKLDVMEVY
ncbi:MAG: flagellar basal body-associated FliL family protein [Treponema sp.]|jgi:flagellar FliL protein|nr:flagellar basal body-associated FliL family protein [Treponema sp.]